MAKIVGIDLGKKLFMRTLSLGSKFNSHNIGNNNQSSGNPEQSCSNLGTSKYSVKLISSHCENLSSITATSKETIANTNAFVNLVASRLTNPGAMNISPIQPADRLPLIPESTLKNDFLTLFTLAKIQSCYNHGGMIKVGGETQSDFHIPPEGEEEK